MPEYFGGNLFNFREDLLAFLELGSDLVMRAEPGHKEFRPANRPSALTHGYVQSTNLHSYLAVAVAVRENSSQIPPQFWAAIDSIVQCETIGEFQRVGEEIGEYLETPIDLTQFTSDFGHLLVEVDMNAPDELVLDSFKNWLKDARTRFNIAGKSRFTPAMMKSWTDNQILPYIDLCLWAKTSDVHIADEIMGHALFPDDYDKEAAGRIRKTVRPKAEFVMEFSVIYALEAQCEDPVQK